MNARGMRHSVDQDMDAVRKWWRPTTWSPWARRVALRFALVVGAYVFWSGYLVFALRSKANLASTGSPPPPPQTMYQQDPGLTRAIFTLAAVALVIETASVVWRVLRHSHRPGTSGMVVAALGGAVAFLGFMTIGIFIAPFVAWCAVLALPIGSEATDEMVVVPPGWYPDPWRHQPLRFWDGHTWTASTWR
jgi:hypothetical protein